MKYKAILMYDLPSTTSKDRKEYRLFRKHIINQGFIMLQESIYIKSLSSKESFHHLQNQLDICSPKKAQIRLMRVTETVYNQMKVIRGEAGIGELLLSSKTRVIDL